MAKEITKTVKQYAFNIDKNKWLTISSCIYKDTIFITRMTSITTTTKCGITGNKETPLKIKLVDHDPYKIATFKRGKTYGKGN